MKPKRAIPTVKVSYINKTPASIRLHISDTRKAFHYFGQSWDKNRIDLATDVYVMLLDRKNCLMGIQLLATGCQDISSIDNKQLYATVVACRAYSFILAINRPDVDQTASLEELELVKRLAKACDLLEIELSDYLILHRYGYHSFLGETLMPG